MIKGRDGFLIILFIIFLVLKLCKVITWSWWLVTLPLWAGLALVVILSIAAIIGVCIVKLLK